MILCYRFSYQAKSSQKCPLLSCDKKISGKKIYRHDIIRGCSIIWCLPYKGTFTYKYQLSRQRLFYHLVFILQRYIYIQVTAVMLEAVPSSGVYPTKVHLHTSISCYVRGCSIIWSLPYKGTFTYKYQLLHQRLFYHLVFILQRYIYIQVTAVTLEAVPSSGVYPTKVHLHTSNSCYVRGCSIIWCLPYKGTFTYK